MTIVPTTLPGAFLIESRVFRDDRGHFLELWQQKRYAEAGLPEFVQDNVSFSRPGVLRGLHYQHPNGQGKLVAALLGRVFDVAVDIRQGSPHFGRWVGVELAAGDGRQFYVPPGFAHGFAVLGDGPAIFAYKCSAFYDQPSEGSIRWDDPDIGIDWPLSNPTLAPKDRDAPRLREVGAGRLPLFEAQG